jgi:surface antigen
MTGNDAAVGRFAWTVAHAQWFYDHGQFNQTPSVGAIVFFDWSGSQRIDAIDHVGIVEAVNDDGSITTIEGNSDDTCKRVIRRANIVGYGHPAYQEVALRGMYDAAYPPSVPPKLAVVAGYIGGNTPHVWTDAEWADQMAKSGAKYKLPIFVRSTGGDPVADATAAVAWALKRGQPKGTLIALDYETRIDATYLNTFDAKVVANGYKTIVYGSRSFVMQNPKPSGGYWTATWDNVFHLDSGATITQYGGDTQGEPYDLNAVADNAPLWGGTVQGVFMALSDAEQAEVLKACRQINAAVGSGQASYESTIEAILGTAQALVNEGRSQTGTVVNAVNSAKTALLGSRGADLSDVLGKVEGNYNAIGAVDGKVAAVDSAVADVKSLVQAGVVVDVAALAAALTSVLGPSLATELGSRLIVPSP